MQVAPVVEEDTTPAKQIVELQAQELNQLSTNEREQVFYEIHGVADVIPEDDPTFVTKKLIEFDKEIIRLSKNNTAAAYNQAASSSSECVQKTEFRVQFLRGDAFDVVAAAGRMISYFQQKLELFGPDKLTNDITLRDFDEDDLKCLKTGSMQTLPIRDRSGRAVLCTVPSLLGKDHSFTMQSRLRALWYVYNSMVEDIEVQKRGFVWVFYAVGSGHFNLEAARKFPKLVKALPVRAVGVHTCFNSSRWPIMTHLGMLVGGQRGRTHMRLHFGTHKEVQSKLTSFGVPCDGEVFPIDPDAGEPRMQNFVEMMKKWETRDGIMNEEMKSRVDMTTTTATTIIPGPNDVLLGRQKAVQDHSGNHDLRNIVNSYRNEYESGKTKSEKTQIAMTIVQVVKETNKGRFLKLEEDSGCWVEVDDKTARGKVAHIFRNQRSKTSSFGVVESSSSKTTTPPPPPQPQQLRQQQQPSKVRLRASVEEEEEEEEDGSSSIWPSKKQRRMEYEGQEYGPSKTDDDADDDDDDRSVGSSCSWLGTLQEFLFGLSSS